MKIINFLLMIASIGVAQAEVYKCPGKVEGQFKYQERPCKGAKADEHTVKIVPADEKKIAEAQKKLAREIEATGNKEKAMLPAGSETKSSNTNTQTTTETSTSTGTTNTTVGEVVTPAANVATPAAVAEPPKASVIRPAPVVPNSMPQKPPVQPKPAN